MTMPAPIPTVDVTEAERRLREDPRRPLLLDVREPDEFAEVRAPGAALLPTSQFMARVGELPADRPLLVVCHDGQPIRGRHRLPDPGRADGCRQRRGRDGGVGEGRPAGPPRSRSRPGEGDLPAG